ncbi:MAG: DNA replication and repair protein RecF [Actinomycetota bacterium]|nr:DNA replication and repair protein RecF [Actinomycetota bacterium]
MRSYEQLDLDLQPGLVLVIGPNGAGKTNLLEAAHVGTQGFSLRTRSDAELVRFGTEAGRVGVHGELGASPLAIEVTVRRGDGKRANLNGAPLRSAERLRATASVLVFTPDRLAVAKGGPAVRRAYFDRAIGRMWAARATLSVEYGAAVAQRNIALRRVASGRSSAGALVPWTERVVVLGARLVDARRELIRDLQPRFTAVAAEVGLDRAELRYDGVAPCRADLEARLDRDLERGATGVGPHLEDVVIVADDREVRAFASQGEQRLAVLSLLLAESELLSERRGIPPLLLLDDVLSELDERRRRILAGRISGPGQALVTATAAHALPIEPAELVEVVPGAARSS